MELSRLGFAKNQIAKLNKKGITNIKELVYLFPRKYYDFRKPTYIADLNHDDIVCVIGKIEEVIVTEKTVRAKIKDNSGRYMYVIWIYQPYVEKQLCKGIDYIFCGKIQFNNVYNTVSMIAPYYFSMNISKYQKIIPIYTKMAGISIEKLTAAIHTGIELMDRTDYLEPMQLEKFNLMKYSKAIRSIHSPESLEDIEEARRRFTYDDLFMFCMKLEEMNKDNSSTKVCHISKFDVSVQFKTNLSFELTDGQKNILNAISMKFLRNERVTALVQGDVGCGKTIVAIILMLISCENGYQSVLMAPTNVLAVQHYYEILNLCKDLPYKIAFLSGETKLKEKKEILTKLKTGDINLLVGTHAVIQDDVIFKNLGLSIVDEEHRFGVEQREQLLKKTNEGAHMISMSATPIPRTLAMSIHGDTLDVYNITTLPKGRQPIQTVINNNEELVYEGLYRQIKEGRQCYIICPLIEDSDYEGLDGVDSVETTLKKVNEYFKKYPEIKIGAITGKIKQKEVAEELRKFSENEYQIIIATTIVEVGVNIPNASVIVIKNAERFGLSQLHQLRGRVGRGNYKSYCVLLSKEINNEKLNAMRQTTNGFEIAEIDLRLRGTGDMVGTKQSGQNHFVTLMLSNPDLFMEIKKEIKNIYRDINRYEMYKFLIA